MILGGVTEVIFDVDAEGQSLEDIAAPLSAVDHPYENPDDCGSPCPPSAWSTQYLPSFPF